MTTGYRSDVYTSEIDLTFTTQLAAASWAVALGQSKEGPLTPQFVTDMPDFVSIYGEPDASVSFLHHSAQAFLREGGGMWIKRVTDGTATYGGKVITTSSSPTVVNGSADANDTTTAPANPTDIVFDSDEILYIYAIGPGKYSSNIECEIVSNNLKTPVATVTKAEDGSLTDGTTYTYKVSAISSLGETVSEEDEDTADSSNLSMSISWPKVVGAQGYRVYREDTVDSVTVFGLIATVNSDTLEYKDTGDTVDRTINPPDNNPTAEPQFTLNVYDARISKTIPRESFECSLKNRKNGIGEQTEIEQSVNRRSKYIRVNSELSMSERREDSTYVAPVVLNVTQFALKAGTNGGDITASHLNSAIEDFRDKDSYPAAVFLDAGYGMVSYHKEIQTICDARGDAIGFTAVPASDQKTLDAIVFRTVTQNINSNRMALFCNDHERLDEYSGETLFVPSSAVAAARLAYTDRVANPAYSIAGFRRGVAGETLKLREKYSDSERDQMAGNNVNYFTTERGAGFVLREAYTLQSAYSALSHISVRRVLDIIEQSTERSLKFYLQEPNDDILVIRMMANLRRFYATLAQRRMIQECRGNQQYSPE